jgi:Ca-activated chloride channel family protein
MENFAFKDPWWLLLLLAIPLVIGLRQLRRAPAWVVPFVGSWYRPSMMGRSRWPVTLFVSGLILAVVALARPQIVEETRSVQREGYDIMLAIDLSGSMLAEDYSKHGVTLNRWAAIKPIIEAFIKERKNDRVGMIVFAGRAYTYAPLTFDQDWLLRQTGRLKIGLIEDGTAIGDGLGLAVQRLELSRQRERGEERQGAFVVLLTDGANNRGLLDPKTAAEIAAKRNIRVYTIGAGRPGDVPFPVFDPQTNQRIGTQMVRSDLDEQLLQFIAQTTGGEFYRAMDWNTTEEAFRRIDQQEKVKFEDVLHVKADEIFAWFAGPGLALAWFGLTMARRQRRGALE